MTAPGSLRNPFLGHMRLASDDGIVSTGSTGQAAFGGGGLFRRSAIEAAVTAGEAALIDTDGASSLFCKCLMGELTGSGSGTTAPAINFYGIIPSGELDEADGHDNPFFVVHSEMVKNTIASGDVTGTSGNPAVVSGTGKEFFTHHDWDTSAVGVGNILSLNIVHYQYNGAKNSALSMLNFAEVGSNDDDAGFVFCHTARMFNQMLITFNKGSLATATGNLYFAPLYH